MKLPTRVIREWKTVKATDGQEIVWIGVLDNGEFALALELPGSTYEQKPLQDLEETIIRNAAGSVRVPTGPTLAEAFGQQHQDEVPSDTHQAFPEVGHEEFDEQGRDAQTRWLQEREELARLRERRQQ